MTSERNPEKGFTNQKKKKMEKVFPLNPNKQPLKIQKK